MNKTKPKHGQLRVWWIPQVPMKQFFVDVETPVEAKKLLGVLADYDRFQFDNRIKPDYCNTGGLIVFDAEDTTDDPEGSWTTWYHEITGEEIDDWEDQYNE